MWNDKASDAPASAGRVDSLEAKRRLLAAVDDLRVAPARPARDGIRGAGDADEIKSLRERLEAAESARRALEEEVRVLECRALTAIAETGRLRRALDEARAEREHDRRETRWRDDGVDLRRGLEAAQLERSLLTSALSESESELSRMARTIDLMTRKLDLAS